MPIFENSKIGTRDFTLIQSHVNNVDGYTLSQDDLAKVDFNNNSTITTDTINKVINNIIVKPSSDDSVQPSLFISEYCEGSDNNRYLEIFNPTDNEISLDDYKFSTVNNVQANLDTSNIIYNNFTSGATIASKGFYIIAHPSANASILRKANQTSLKLSNGNDGLTLLHHPPPYSIITGVDTLGTYQGDIVDGWDVAGVSNATKDHTLIRKPNVKKGNTDWNASRGTNMIDSEWYVRQVDSIFNIRTHEMDGVVYTDLLKGTFKFKMLTSNASGIENNLPLINDDGSFKTLTTTTSVDGDYTIVSVDYVYVKTELSNDGVIFQNNTTISEILEWGKIPLTRNWNFDTEDHMNRSPFNRFTGKISTVGDDIPTILPNTSFRNLFYQFGVTTQAGPIDNSSYGNISNWNTAGVIQFRSAFYGQTKFNHNLSNWDFSGAKGYSGVRSIFTFCENFNNGQASGESTAPLTIDCGTGETLFILFYDCESFNQPITFKNTSSITEMRYLFYKAASFNQSISSLDTSNVTTMDRMFSQASNFNQAVSNFDTSNVTNMNEMFYNATSFNQSVSNFDTSNVILMYRMFAGATSFNQSLSNFDTSNVITMSNMFYNATSFNQSVSNFDTSNVATMNLMFSGATSFNQSVSNFDTSNVTTMNLMFSGATSFNQALSNFDTSNVIYMNSMFNGATSFNQDIRDWNISSLTATTDMFTGATEMINTYTGTVGFGNTPGLWFWNSHEQPPTLTDITIEEVDGQTNYDIELKDYTTIYVDGASKNDLSYNLIPIISDKYTVNTVDNTFTTPNTSTWTQFSNWTYDGNYNISLGSDTFTLGDNTYSSIWAGGNGRIVFNSGADYDETISEFLAEDMICACWDLEFNSGYSRAYWIIENNQFKIYADTREYPSSAAQRQYIITLNLDSHSEPKIITFEYGNMDGTGAVGDSWAGARDGIIGISYGQNNTETLTTSNINYLEPATDVNFNKNQPIMQQFLHNTNVGQGTDQLINKKITFGIARSNFNGVSITGSTFTLDSNTVIDQIWTIQAIQEKIVKASNIATVTWYPLP